MDIPAELKSRDQRAAAAIQRAFSFASLKAYTLRERILIRLADLVFFILISLIGRTIRWEIEGWDNFEASSTNTKVPIFCIWHNRVFLNTYFFRKRSIVVMTSQSFDGEYIARFIQRFGYGAARGSSTRGGTGALVELIRLISAGLPIAFTIDGPKGPAYVAKLGGILLGKKTGQPIVPVNVTAKKYWYVNSWDKLQIPKPFTKARVEVAPPLFVPHDADDTTLEQYRQQLQLSLEQLNKRGEEWRSK